MSSVIYEFRVDGRVPERARDAFCGMQVEEVAPGLILRARVIDESHLMGIISEFRVLDLSLVSVHPVASRLHRTKLWWARGSATWHG